MQFSTSDKNRSYTEVLNKRVKKEAYSTEDEWIHFLMDHRELIQKNSILLVMNEEILGKYSYRIKDFLNDKGYNQEGMDTVFRVANRMGSDMFFNNTVTSIYLPENNYVAELRRMYATNKAVQVKLQSKS